MLHAVVDETTDLLNEQGVGPFGEVLFERRPRKSRRDQIIYSF